MKPSQIKDKKLAKSGKLKLQWAKSHMPILTHITQQFSKTKPFKHLSIAACLHITKESGILLQALRAGGARVSIAACNPLSTQDDVAAALAQEGFYVYGWRGLSSREYYRHINSCLDIRPDITIDDACDLIFTVHTQRTQLLPQIIGGCEETTSGVNRLKAMEKAGALKYPVIAVNNARTKQLFDNRYGTGQSTFDGILRATNLLIAGKTVVVIGYGWCGRGIAARAKGLGASVIVTETDPIKALEAKMDGFNVMPISQAARIGQLFITATGNRHALDSQHFKLMPDGATICNAGHFNVEINLEALKQLTKKSQQLRPNNTVYHLKNGRKLYLLAEGRLVNLSSAEGHPSEVMDMSFSTQALSAEFLVKNQGKLEPKVYATTQEQDAKIARFKLKSMGISIDRLTSDQKHYLASWQQGT